MRYSSEPRDKIYVKAYGYLSFAKNMGKNLSNKYCQKLLDRAKKSTAGAIKTSSKRAIQKTTETTGDLIGNKISDKITSVSKKSPKELHSQTTQNKDEIEIPKERYIYIYIQKKDIRFKTTMLRSSLCDSSGDTYILMKGR